MLMLDYARPSFFVLIAASSGFVACDQPLLQTVEAIEPANDSGAACAPSPASDLVGGVVSGEVTLGWSVGELDNDGVLVERRRQEDAWVQIAELSASAETFLDANAAPDTQYAYRVIKFRTTTNQRCESLASDEAEVLTVPDRVDGFTATLGAGGATLQWTNGNTTSTGVLLERRIEEGAWEPLIATTSPLLDAPLTPNSRIEYRLAAINASGRGPRSFAEVQTDASPSAAWAGPLRLDATCYLRSDVELELADGASVSATTADIDRAGSGLVSYPEGMEVVLEDLSEGTLTLSWAATDSQGLNVSLSREFSVTSSTVLRAQPAVPDTRLGLTSSLGGQPINAGCGECAGRRAQVAVGSEFACSLSQAGEVRCWGDNGDMQLGQGDSAFLVNPQVACLDELCLEPLVVNDLWAEESSTCVTVGPSHELRCWGSAGFNGVLGNGDDRTSNARPEPVCLASDLPSCTPLIGVVEVATYQDTRCAVVESGDVYCWGRNDYDRILGSTESEIVAATRVCTSGADASGDCVPLTNVTEIIVGIYHQCVLMDDGSVACWGWNDQGQLGSGVTEFAALPPRPVCAPGAVWDGSQCGASDARLANVIALGGGAEHTCALIGTGEIFCWGDNTSSGHLGDGTTIDRPGPSPVCLSGASDGSTCVGGAALTGAVQLHSDFDGHCAILNDGSARCWGVNTSGRLGNGNDDSSGLLPTKLCASGAFDLDADECLDDGLPSPLTDIRALRMGNWNTCATVGDSGRAYCWGRDSYSLGSGDAVNFGETFTPRDVCLTGSLSRGDCAVLDGQRSAGIAYRRGYAVGRDGTVRVWGQTRVWNSGTMLGSESIEVLDVPVTVRRCAPGETECVALGNVVQLAAGDLHACALQDNGTIWCWGDGDRGQLGNGEEIANGNPSALCEVGRWNGEACVSGGTQRPPMGNFVSVSAYSFTTCAVDEDGRVWCWGSNDDNKSGSGIPASQASQLPNPVPVTCEALVPGCEASGAPIRDIVSIAVGGTHVCAIHRSGQVVCWGAGDEFQLGNGLRIDRPHPTSVPLPAPTAQLAMSRVSTCALGTDGIVRCWGSNDRSQLGFGLSDTFVAGATTASPVCESGDFTNDCVPLSEVAGITGFGSSYCALKIDGTVRCWGWGANGRLGNAELDTSFVNQYPNPITPCAPAPGTDTCIGGYDCSATPLSNVVAVDLGGLAGCAVLVNGTVECWGRDGAAVRGDAGLRSATECVAASVCGPEDLTCANEFDDATVRSCQELTVTEL